MGSEQLVPLNLRVVAATNRQLQDEVAAGRFRKDLYFRLQVMDLALPPQAELIERVVYQSEAQPLPAEAARLLRQGALVLLHSGEAARHFARECDRLGLTRDAIALAALGPRIAAAAGSGWRQVQTAASAEDSALLALADKMCHTGA